MTTMMSDLSQDLIEEILSRVPITSRRVVRSTCKGWNGLSIDQRFKEKHCDKATREFMWIMIKDYRVCLRSVNLHGIHNHGDLFDQSINKIKLPKNVKMYKVFHGGGLLLCLTKKDIPKLVVWNPYLGQFRWIQPRNNFHIYDKYSIGYDNSNKNHKILFFNPYVIKAPFAKYGIYEFKSNSWRVLDVIQDHWYIPYHQPGVFLKGNTYFVAHGRLGEEQVEKEDLLLCFDFTRERFGPRLPLPFHSNCLRDSVVLSSVRGKQLAVLLKRAGTHEMEIWITTKIELNAVSWRNFFVVNDEKILSRISNIKYGSFFVDEEKKFVVVCVTDIANAKRTNNIAHMIREDGYYKQVDLGESRRFPIICAYVPSLAQIH